MFSNINSINIIDYKMNVFEEVFYCTDLMVKFTSELLLSRKLACLNKQTALISKEAEEIIKVNRKFLLNYKPISLDNLKIKLQEPCNFRKLNYQFLFEQIM